MAKIYPESMIFSCAACKDKSEKGSKGFCWKHLRVIDDYPNIPYWCPLEDAEGADPDEDMQD